MIGKRVRMRYGLATIVDELDECVVGVVADVGGYWICTVEEIWLVDDVETDAVAK